MDNNIRLTYRNDSEIHYFLFENNSTFLFKDVFTQDNQENISDFDFLSYSELLNIHLNKSRYNSGSRYILLRYKDKIQFIDLVDVINKMHLDKDWHYDYIESINTTNKPYEIAFITHNPTYGVQGIKILKFNKSFDFDLIYEMEDLELEGAFHNLTFNSNSNKFSLLLYNYNYLTICEYSIGKKTKSLNEIPQKMFKTEFEYFKKGILKLNMKYLNDNTLCIVRNSDFIIFDLNEGKTLEIINRDLDTSYLITSHSLKYKMNKKSCEIDLNQY
ncbi:hypothetical protein [Aureivirga sp. CE67]|uniref:hypothetical protein n=1 Tax=Aureivirga sp. CE67 TaxID=1788983 RepID=UPI0018C8DF8C|nr:hypothetical protein [Aureivirga sp. CE67]